jgi:ubiquinone/menaquinone biosynthesis C-methylase UbiE
MRFAWRGGRSEEPGIEPADGDAHPGLAGREHREKEFHDHSHAERTRSKVSGFYSLTSASRAYLESQLLIDLEGRRILEYGCGLGSKAFMLARRGASVVGIDISGVAIGAARDKAALMKGPAPEFVEMSAHALEFADEEFDMVCGTAILHHLDIDKALGEVARVLRPGGRAVFYEPLGHNPLINWYRKRTPDLRTADEHPLRMDDLRTARRWFEQVEERSFHLFSLAAGPLRRFSRLVAFLDRVDRIVFRIIPPLRKHAWVVVLTLTGPRKRPVDL